LPDYGSGKEEVMMERVLKGQVKVRKGDGGRLGKGIETHQGERENNRVRDQIGNTSNQSIIANSAGSRKTQRGGPCAEERERKSVIGCL